MWVTEYYKVNLTTSSKPNFLTIENHSLIKNIDVFEKRIKNQTLFAGEIFLPSCTMLWGMEYICHHFNEVSVFNKF